MKKLVSDFSAGCWQIGDGGRQAGGRRAGGGRKTTYAQANHMWSTESPAEVKAALGIGMPLPGQSND